MKKVKPEELQNLLISILSKAGVPPDIASYVSEALVDSNIKGVDSHGAVRVSMYVDQIFEGYMNPSARPEIVSETPTTAIVRGCLGLGIFALGYALNLAIQKAKTNHVAAVGLFENTHTGRLGRFSEIAAEQGVYALITGGGGNPHPRHCSVAPYGGSKRFMATNPFAFGLPGGEFGPVVVDTSTSMTAEGKLRVYRATKTPVPEGWILDKDGRPTTDAEDFYAGGVILPAAGHKGFGFGLIAELLGDALVGNPYELNWFIIAVDIAAFRPLSEFTSRTEEILHKLKEVPPAAGHKEVMFPGEPEAQIAKQRMQTGITFADEIWEKILETAGKVGVEPNI